MKLKDIKGLLPNRDEMSNYETKDLSKFDRTRATGYNQALSEIGEKELVVDVEKVVKIIQKDKVFVGNTIDVVDRHLAQATAKTDIFKVEE